MDIMDKNKFIFGALFLLTNKLQVIGDQFLGEDGVTTRQWFLSVLIGRFGEYAPTLSEVAQLLGSSHQNVKQLALKLESKGLLRIEKDPEDGRALRLKLTDKSRAFWEQRQEKDDAFIRKLFSGVTEEETNAVYTTFNKLIEKIINSNDLIK